MTAEKKVKKSFLIPAYLDSAVKEQLEREPWKDYTTIIVERLDGSYRSEGLVGKDRAESKNP